MCNWNYKKRNREDMVKKIFEEIMAEVFQNLVKDINL